MKNIIFAIILITSISVVAQQDPNYTLYRYNMNLVNPAYAGAHEGAELGVNVRSQWANVEGAPETQSLFFGTGVGKKLGLGVSVINDRTFIEDQTSLAIDVSYYITLNTNIDLYFGVKVGANSYSANTGGLLTFGISEDPSLTNLDGGFSPNVGAGVYLKAENYFVSFSVPKILSPDRLEQNNGLARLGTDKVHMYLAMGYDLKISESVVFKPSTMARYVDSAPLSIDLTAAFQFYERFEPGIAYRLDEGISGFAIFNAANWIDIGYAYESAFDKQIESISNGTHEIFLKIKF